MDIPRDFFGLQKVARDSHGFSSLKHLDLSNTSGQCSCVFQGIRKKRVLTMHVTDVPKPPSLTRRVALHPWHGLYSPHARFTGSNFLIELIAIVATTAPKFLGVCILQIRNLVGFCMVLPRIFVDTPIDGLTSSYGCFLIWGYPKI